MNDRDKPVNPFGRVERTIIRPNPGGRLPQARDPLPQAPDPLPQASDPGRAPPRAPYSPMPPSASPASSYSPQSAGYAAPPTSHPAEEWASTPAMPQQPDISAKVMPSTMVFPRSATSTCNSNT